MIEEKKVYLNIDYVNDYIESLHYFGWLNKGEGEELVDNKMVKYKLLVRNTEIDNYSELVELEKEYENNRNELLPVVKVNVLLCIFLMIFILPGLIYYDIKSGEIKNVNEHNELYYKNIYLILEKAKNLNNERKC